LPLPSVVENGSAMAVTLRPATLADADSIAENIKSLNTPEEIREQIRIFAVRNMTHIVAEDDGRIVGNALLVPSRYYPQGEAHRAELADFVISASHQGSGLARRLIDAIAEAAITEGVTHLETSCRDSDARALGAYRGLGFIEWGHLPNAWGEGGLTYFYKPLT
jgi:GNAT superfamily N-acetyltransferase